MKLLIIGSGGQLGNDLVRQATMAGHSVIHADYPQIDIRNISSVYACINKANADAIINCAAFTEVDNCESEYDRAFALNADACWNLAAAAKKIGALLIHFSTDYVFDGEATTPYTEDSPANPQTVYGKSKLRGEEIITKLYADNSMIFRIAWLYGAYGHNFVKTIQRIADNNALSGKSMKIVCDQFGTPTWTVNICRQVLAMLGRQERGIFHCTSEGSCSWFDFAKEIVYAAGTNVRVLPCPTEEQPRPAPRPRYSVLENMRLKELGVNIMPGWLDGFREFLSTGGKG
jgi:dTDP-4-dehydrorhamnose reductase